VHYWKRERTIGTARNLSCGQCWIFEIFPGGRFEAPKALMGWGVGMGCPPLQWERGLGGSAAPQKIFCFFLPRDARSAKRGIAIVSRPSVRLSVCPSVRL